jgi:hypothetical protein
MSTFVIGSTTATFKSTIQQAHQTIGDLQEFVFGVYLATQADWLTLQTLVTTKYHVHVPLGGGNVIVDIVRGPGAGTLTIDGLGGTSGIMTTLSRPTYLPNGKSVGSATFLITGSPL